MAGDVFNAKADYYYPAPVTNNSNPLIGDIVTALMAAITGNPAASGVIHGGTANISNDLNTSVPFKSIADPHQTGAGNIPRAYLNVMFFNERFEFVEEGSTALRVSQPGDNASPLVLSNIKAPKNGYVYIYLSNENDDAVYFDNFTVSYTRGRIIEENHYYAFGLRIAGISSKKFDGGMEGSLKNGYLYQGDFAELDEDIEWHDFELRNYDAQTGRWIQQDPFQQFHSPYSGMGNDPVNLIDPSGGIGIPCPGASPLLQSIAKAGDAVIRVLDAIAPLSSVLSVGINVANAAANIFNRSVEFELTNRQLVRNGTGQVGSAGNPLELQSLLNNPDFSPLSTQDLRNMVRQFNSNLESWQVNISAGLLLEDLYQEFSGFPKNTSSSIEIVSGKPYIRSVVPDFRHPTILNDRTVYPMGGVIEVKALQSSVKLATSRYQIEAEIDMAGYAGGTDGTRAGSNNAGAFTLVLPFYSNIDAKVVEYASRRGVNMYVSYAFINRRTGRIVFSNPGRLNKFRNKEQSYTIGGNINGVVPNLKKATNRWRILNKKDGDNE